MLNWNDTLIDWVNLSPNSEVLSLWICLHDGELIGIKSDLPGQSVVLEFNAFYLPDELTGSLRLDGVTSVRAYQYPCPYKSLLTDDLTPAAQQVIGEAWATKWREESMSWQEFEAAMPTDPLDILEADLAKSEGQIALRLGGYLNGEKYDDLMCSIYLRAGSLSALRSDGQDFSLDAFMELGRQWWESFANREL